MRIRNLVISAALVGTVLAAPVPAEATLSQCASNKMCVWGNNGYDWLLAAQLHNQGLLDVFNDGLNEDDAADSWANRSASYNGCLYDDEAGQNSLLTMGKVSNDTNMSVFDSDKTDAMRTNRGC